MLYKATINISLDKLTFSTFVLLWCKLWINQSYQIHLRLHIQYISCEEKHNDEDDYSFQMKICYESISIHSPFISCFPL